MILDGWRELAFGELAYIANGQVDPRIEPYSSYPHIGPENVVSESGRLQGVQLAKELGLISGKYLFDEKAIVYSKIRPNLNKVCIPRFVGICSADMYPIWTNIGVDQGFLFQYMLSSLFVHQATIASGRTGLPKINREDLNRIKLQVPPLAEQRKIAAILGTWDAAITAAEQLVAALQMRKKALMQMLLTGQIRFPGFEDEWEEVSLGDFLTYSPRKVDKPSDSYTRMGIRSHGKGTFTEIVQDPGKIAMDHLFEVKANDLIVSITFAWEHAIALVSKENEGALVSHRFPTYEFNRAKVIPEFFRHLMLTERFLEELDLISPGGAGRNRVMSKAAFLKIKVRIPPIQEQQQIGQVLNLADQSISQMRLYSEKLQEQKRALMQKLLTGEVRVTVSEADD